MTPEEIIESQRANLDERCAREDTLLQVICDIRHKTGLGHKPMLSELADAIMGVINAAYARGLEDAAKVSDDYGDYADGGDIADAIRALKEPSNG